MKTQPMIRNRYILIGDLLLIIASAMGSYALRLELGAAFLQYMPTVYWLIGVGLVVKPLFFAYFGLYRRMWKYASVREVTLIVLAVTTSSLVVSVLMISLHSLGLFIGLSRSALAIDWLLTIILCGGLRLSLRVLAENASVNGPKTKSKRALIVGAGDAGALVVRELQKNPQINLSAACFVDDNPTKQRQQIYGIPVLGTLTDLARVLDNQQIDEVIIAIPSAPGRIIRMVSDICRLKGIPFRTMPGIYELLGGKVSVSRLRDVDITDLLRREPARMRDEEIGETLNGRVVLVTGAGGSIGRELCRQIARWGPAELLMLGHGENSIFEALLDLQESFPSLVIHPLICDVRDRKRLENLMAKHRPQVVFHAAAHKHVPMMEKNIEEAVSNNILGTRNLVDLSLAHGVERLVMISTDKAIRPVNVMGATKRIGEMIVLDAAARSGLAYSVVRFGNVLGSRGSVVPIFKRQIARGGPITITHPDMRRYFMTIPEAVYLVLQSASLGTGGETFVLNMGQQIRILDLAEDLIRLSGLTPGRDIEIVFTGVRPGEKLSEDLWDEGSAFQPTAHPDIFNLEVQDELHGETLQRSVDELGRLAREGDTTSVVRLLDELIPGSEVRCTPPLELTSID
ncbi:MAG TPA: nucleoside-diphosphate sugar epimerase/dehydratase [Longilinea sp.]|nr:nucleoside-diphosphate sugar epimerase/dehydratase [Longilinea sp.]